MTLAGRAVRAGGWTVVAHGADTSIRLLSSLILTRLLFPEAFGLVAVATSILIGLTLITDVGIRTSVLRSPIGDQDDFLRAAWTLQLCRGLAIWLVLVSICAVLSLSWIKAAFPRESVFAHPQFPTITASLGIGLVLSGFESTAIYLNVRKIHLRPVIFLDTIGRLASFPVTIIWAWATGSVWAIVGGSLLSSAIRLAMSHVAVPGPRMSWYWHRPYIRELAHFGRWISVSSTATFFGGQSDRLVSGVLLPSSDLGRYSIAKLLIEAADGLLDRLSSSLTAPVLGEVIRKDVNQLRSKYYRFRLPFDLGAPLISGVLFSAGSLVVNILFDQRYESVGPMLQILALGLMFYPMLLISHAFPLVGEPRMTAVISILQASSLITCVLVGFYLGGPLGMVTGVAIHKAAPSLFVLVVAYNRGWIDALKELRVVPGFLIGILLGNGLSALFSAIVRPIGS